MGKKQTITFENVGEVAGNEGNPAFRENIEKILGKQIAENPDEYTVTGKYAYEGSETPFWAELKVDKNNQVLGRMTEDEYQRIPQLNSDYYVIAGKLTNDASGPARISFVKIPLNPWAAPIYYNLEKSDAQTDKIDGDYSAVWHFEPHTVFPSSVPILGATQYGDYAEFNLKMKKK